MSEELAWAAGFWDGEGSCGYYIKNDGRARKASASYLKGHIGQNHREPLDRFVAAVGVGKVYGPYQTGERKNPHWNYQIAGKSVEALIGQIWPWLCEPKRRQFLAAKERFANRPEKGLRTGRSCPPDCTCRRHHWLYEELDEKQARRRQQKREAQRRHREKMKLA